MSLTAGAGTRCMSLLSSSPNLFTSDIPFPWFLMLGCNSQAQDLKFLSYLQIICQLLSGPNIIENQVLIHFYVEDFRNHFLSNLYSRARNKSLIPRTFCYMLSVFSSLEIQLFLVYTCYEKGILLLMPSNFECQVPTAISFWILYPSLTGTCCWSNLFCSWINNYWHSSLLVSCLEILLLNSFILY